MALIEPATKSTKELIKDLPLLPTIVVELLALSPKDDDYFIKIEALSERDPPLALKIIQLSNTAKHVGIRPITSIKEAIIRLGSQEVFNLIALVAIVKVFVPSCDSEKRLWLHSLEVAEINKMVCGALNSNEIKIDTAYLIGLLHDIGLFLRFENSFQDFHKVQDLYWDTPSEHLKNEMTLLHENHAFLGGKVCKFWGIPSPIPETIFLHHHYKIPDKYKSFCSFIDSVRALQFSDLVSELTRLEHSYDKERLIEVINNNAIMKRWISNINDTDSLFAHIEECLEIANEKYQLLNL